MRVEGAICDVGDAEQRNKLVRHIRTKHGRLDVLVPNAAISNYMGNQMEISERKFDQLW